MPGNNLPEGILETNPKSVEGELLPPISTRDDALRQRWVKLLSVWTDTVFEVPGLGWRFGLDPIIGLVPVVGDLASALVSFYILSLAAQMQVPRVTLVRMMLNVAIDYVVGSIPLLGNVFDFGWKANYWNAQLLERTLAAPAYERRQQTIWDWLFVGGLMTLLVAVVIGSLVAAILIAAWIAKRLGAAF